MITSALKFDRPSVGEVLEWACILWDMRHEAAQQVRTMRAQVAAVAQATRQDARAAQAVRQAVHGRANDIISGKGARHYPRPNSVAALVRFARSCARFARSTWHNHLDTETYSADGYDDYQADQRDMASAEGAKALQLARVIRAIQQRGWWPVYRSLPPTRWEAAVEDLELFEEPHGEPCPCDTCILASPNGSCWSTFGTCPEVQRWIAENPQAAAEQLAGPEPCALCGAYPSSGSTWTREMWVDNDPGDAEVGPQPDVGIATVCDKCYREHWKPVRAALRENRRRNGC